MGKREWPAARSARAVPAAAGLVLVHLAGAVAAGPPAAAGPGVRLGGEWVALERGRVPELPPGGEPVHLLVGLSPDAPPGALAELESRGFRQQGRGPGSTWYVRARREQVEELLAWPWVEGLAVPPAAGKLAAALRARPGPGDDLLPLVVLFYPGVDPGQATAALNGSVRGPLPVLEPASRRLELTVRRDDLLRIAGEDAVFQVWPAPPPRQAENLSSRDTSDLEMLAATHPGLEGGRVRLGIWDAGRVRETHVDLAGRVVQMDGAGNLSGHATHVAGTLASRGTASPSTLGMAPRAGLWAFDFFSDTAEMEAHADSLHASNHSYGYIAGWSWNYDGSGLWHWFAGDPAASVDAAFGKYDFTAWDFDLQVAAHDLPVFKSAGNDRNDAGASGADHHHGTDTGTPHQDSHQSDGAKGGFDTLSYFGVAKNIIAVGAVHDVTSDPVELAAIFMAAYSSWGPADDGRIKPDLVANGATLFSSSAESDTGIAGASGTSMASPSAAGAFALLADRALATPRAGIPVGAAEAKGLLIHGAVDAGRTGPDYEFGWGLINGDRSLAVLEGEFGAQTRVRRAAITAARADQALTIHAGAGGILKATLTWVDPAGSPNTGGNDDPAPALVNDLDLLVTSPAGVVHHPWTLDPAEPTSPAARTGPNRVDNVEQVLVDAGSLEVGDWTVRVVLNGVLTGIRQPYHLIITFPCGPDDPDCDGCGLDAVNDADGDGACADWDVCPATYDPLQKDRNDNGIGDACDADDGLIQDVAFGGTSGEMVWMPETGAASYNVYRQTATSSAPGDAGGCFAFGLTTAAVEVSGVPAGPGEVWLLQVTGVFADGEGPLGEGRDGGPRAPAAACP